MVIYNGRIRKQITLNKQKSRRQSGKQENRDITPQKSNIDTQNDGLEKVTPFFHGNFCYPAVRFLAFFARGKPVTLLPHMKLPGSKAWQL